MEKFTLRHTVLYAKNWYKRYSAEGERKTIWEDLVLALEMDGYIGSFEGESPEQIKNRVAYLIVGQFERLPKKGSLTSLQSFYEGIKPHNCWKYGYYTKGFTLMRSKEEIENSPDYDYNEAVARYCLSYFLGLSKEEWGVCPPDYTTFSKPKSVKREDVKRIFENG
jgi:hypothetical protein